mgnify:FL=1
MEPKLPKIKPNIQPNKIVGGNKGVYGGVKNIVKGVNPLVRNITGSDNLFSKLQERNPEVRNKRGTRTLFNMLGTFGTERNEKIIRRNLQLLRNTLIETFEIAKLLRMNAAMGAGGGNSGGELNMGLLTGIAGAGGLGLLAGLNLPKLFGGDDEEKDDEDGGGDEDQIQTFIDDVTKESDKVFPKVGEYTDEKLNSDLDNSSKEIETIINNTFGFLNKDLTKLINGDDVKVDDKTDDKTDDKQLKVEEESGGNQQTDSLVSGIENSFKDNLKGEIVEGESNNNYGAMFSRDQEGFSRGDEDITKMSISDVDKLQTDYLNYQKSIGREEDNRSAAMGAYQMLDVKKVAELMGLDPETTIFNQETQDMMADYYLNYAGLKEFQAGEITAEEFNNRLAEQFASIETTSGKGMYDDDGMNKANTSVFNLIKSQESKLKKLDTSKLKSESNKDVIIIDNSKGVEQLGGGKKTSTVVNMNKGKTKSSGPDLVFLPSSDPDSTNITTKSILGVIG